VKRFLLAGLLGLAACAPTEREESFAAVSVLLDSGAAELAAWQIELVDARGLARITGIEGGEHAAFREPARHDPAALRGGRVRLAAFSLANELPRGETRVVTVHYALPAGSTAGFTLRVEAAAARDGEVLEVKGRIE
jgi:hypothetical protein